MAKPFEVYKKPQDYIEPCRTFNKLPCKFPVIYDNKSMSMRKLWIIRKNLSLFSTSSGNVLEELSGSYYYHFRLNDFIGDLILLKCKINDLFQYFRSSKTYIMKDICEVFEKFETNCISENFHPDMYIDHGNQSYEASFDLKSYDETAEIKLEIENLEHRKNYYESQINDYKNIVREYNEKIQELKAKLESNA